MGRRVLRRYIWGYSVCPCPIKRTHGLYGLIFLDGDDPRRPSNGVYISQLIRFARELSHVGDFICRNNFLTAKILNQGYISIINTVLLCYL